MLYTIEYQNPRKPGITQSCFVGTNEVNRHCAQAQFRRYYQRRNGVAPLLVVAHPEPNGNANYAEAIDFPATDLDGYDRERDEKFEEEHEL